MGDIPSFNVYFQQKRQPMESTDQQPEMAEQQHQKPLSESTEPVTAFSQQMLSSIGSKLGDLHPPLLKSDRNKSLGYVHNRYKTQMIMRQRTSTMDTMASRGFQREGYPPTRQTNPPMHSRRWSVDVNTADYRETQFLPCPIVGDGYYGFQSAETAKSSHELEPVPRPMPTLPPPYPFRYPELGKAQSIHPPHDTEIYLELGTATIRNDAFNYITQFSWNVVQNECWMRGESLGMALEVLRRDKNCEDYGIGFANELSAQMMHLAHQDNEGHTHHYDSTRAQLGDKKWIFILMNDAIGTLQEGGTHWSLIVVDRVHKLGHYYDSLKIDNYSQQGIACRISYGLLDILGENRLQWRFSTEYNSPNQFLHNQFDEDDGACGPFVYKMSEWLVNRIKKRQDAGMEDRCYLSLAANFPYRFRRHFDSREVRVQMAKGIARWKARAIAPFFVEQHDIAAVIGQNVALSDRPMSPFRLPRPKRARTASETTDEASERGGRVALFTNNRHYIIVNSSSDELLSDTPSDKSGSTEEIKLDDDTMMEAPEDIQHPPPQLRRSNSDMDMNEPIDWQKIKMRHARRTTSNSSSDDGIVLHLRVGMKRNRRDSHIWSMKGSQWNGD